MKKLGRKRTLREIEKAALVVAQRRPSLVWGDQIVAAVEEEVGRNLTATEQQAARSTYWRGNDKRGDEA